MSSRRRSLPRRATGPCSVSPISMGLFRFFLLMGVASYACGKHVQTSHESTAADASNPDGAVAEARDAREPFYDARKPFDAKTPDADTRIYPLARNRVWSFDVRAVGTGAVCAPGNYRDEVVGVTSMDGREVFEVQGWCSAVGTVQMTVQGDLVRVRYGDDWIVVADEPVQEGHHWVSTGPVSYTWRDVGTVTVPAGTFDNCWKREQDVTYTAYTIFCRGIGPVRSYSEDLAGNGWDAELVDYSL